MVETPLTKSVAFKLEVERVALLYRQNIPGVLGLLLYAFSYAYVCGDVMGSNTVRIWLGVVFVSAMLRLGASWLWLRSRDQIENLAQVRRWLRFIQSQLFVSGAAWGVAGWMMRYSNTPEQQIFVSMTVVFMVAGGIVCWSISPRAMLFVVVPAFVPWSLGQVFSDNPLSVLMGILSLLYLVLGTRVGLALHRYVEDSLKLTIENAQLNEVLKNEIRERDVHEAANKAKSMFLANASHEIRTPLAAISGFVEALLQSIDESSPDSQQAKSDLLAIDRNSRHLISLMNDFLDLSKLESGHLEVQKKPVNLRGEIQQSVQMVQSALDAKKLNFELSCDPSLPEMIESDALRFRQILVNLLSNGIKFSSAGTLKVRVSHQRASADDGRLVINVADSGMGMNESTKRHLFEPFVRGASEEVQRVSGSGLGLTLSRNLARSMGGDLKLIDSTLGEGSQFEFSVGTGSIHGLAVPAPIERFVATNQLPGLLVLVVDDDADLRDLMKRFLERQGAIVDIATNGQQAIDRALTQRYDVILMDMKMPVLDGYAATSQLRANGYRSPVIALTAYANSCDRRRSLEAGCDNYLTKPVDFSNMLRLVRTYVPFREPVLRHLDS
ncbi:hypothetical protein BH10BDE1_BH10BDE1_12740 [soil metagenome]